MKSPLKRPLEPIPVSKPHYDNHPRAAPPPYDIDDPPAKRSVKDRLGVGGVKVKIKDVSGFVFYTVILIGQITLAWYFKDIS